MAFPFDGEETESDRGGAPSSSDSDSSVAVRALGRWGRALGAEESSDESDSDSSDDGGAQVKAERFDRSDVEYEDDKEDDEDGEEDDEDDDDGDDQETIEEEEESSEEDEQEEVQDDVMFKEEQDVVDDDGDSDYKEEDDDEEEEEEEEQEGEEEEVDDKEAGRATNNGEYDSEDEPPRPARRAQYVPHRPFDPRRKGREVPKKERGDLAFVLHQVRTFVPTQERAAIKKGGRVTGPPVHDPLSPLQRLARKFRWPTHLRNVRNTNFAQDPVELIEDHELPVTASRVFKPTPGQSSSAFAAPPRPLMESVVKAVCHVNRKRKRESTRDEDSAATTRQEQAISGDALVTLARAGAAFSDRYMQSLLQANLAALQGVAGHDAYSQRSWAPLPASRKPVANWRFVLEHLLMNRDARFGEPDDAFWPRMSDATLRRIRDRLKSLNRATWKPEDDKLFDLMTREGRQLDDTVDEAGAEPGASMEEESGAD